MILLKIFIGYDDRETVAYHVLSESIRQHASRPVSITPLVRSQLEPQFSRARGPLESTDFAFSRFMVPYLCDYQGLAVFMDCDMLVKADIYELLLYTAAYPGKAVYCCQHDYSPNSATKFQGHIQTVYPRKNWSSLMVFDARQCRMLTPQLVNTATGADLHRFTWLDDSDIGSLPVEWNWLVGEYPLNPDAKNLHYTLGGPWFPETANCDHAQEWVLAWQTAMGIQKTAAVRA